MGAIVIIPTAGLGNRIRAIASAYGLAKQYNKKLKIVWVAEQGLHCPFYDLFETADDFEVVEYSSKARSLAALAFYKLAGKLGIKKIGGKHLLYDLNKFTDNTLKHWNNLLIVTCQRFYTYPAIPLRFSKKITDAGNDFLQSVGSDFIGIHVRTGDNVLAVKNSPVDLFIKKVAEELQHNKPIFLCTDDTAVKEKFKAEFGNRVFTREAVLTRSTSEGIIDAAIDMYCLSKAQKLYGSFNSSFSTIASEFNNTPLVRLKLEAPHLQSR